MSEIDDRQAYALERIADALEELLEMARQSSAVYEDDDDE